MSDEERPAPPAAADVQKRIDVRGREAAAEPSGPPGKTGFHPRLRAHVVVRGHVQGVFFRGSARDRARSLGVAGWARNNPDGTVEAVFEGPGERVESMVAWCRRGPAGADVRGVEVEWGEPRGEDGFSVG
jgi:acylphosphatase